MVWSMAVSVSLLADRPESIRSVAQMRWREWGQPPEPVDPDWWLETTRREAGRDHLPVTFVAMDANDSVGAVGLDEYDLDERHDKTPWVTGTIVRADRRGVGVGSALMRHLEVWAAEHGFAEAWVGTGCAAGFYRRCGWHPTESFVTADGQRMNVLHKRFN